MSNTKKKHISEDYVKTDVKGLRKHKTNKRLFLFDFRIHGIRYRKKFEVKATNHSLSENKEEATSELLKYKKSKRSGHALTEYSTLDECFYEYMKDKEDTDWNKKLIRNYSLYIGDCKLFEPSEKSIKRNILVKKYKVFKVGYRKISEIEIWHFDNIQNNMKKHKLSERTRNSIFEILNPLYKWMLTRRIVDENIATDLKIKIDLKKQKRVVVNAEKLFTTSYQAINNVFKDDAFYRAFFLFGFSGRRKSEILELKWSHIDLENNTYVLNDPKGSDHQEFILPDDVKKALLKIPDNRRGFVFKSPLLKGKSIKNIDRQVQKLKEELNNKKYCMHFMRHILVSTLANKGVPKITLSGVLGHTDLQSINRYITNDYKEAAKLVAPVIEDILEVA